MSIPSTIQTFHFANTTVQAYVPLMEWLQQQSMPGNSAVPYWAQVWPAAMALCEVIANEPALVKDKDVLEIAAGLALPSLLAAQFAKQAVATDHIEEAVELIKLSVDHNGLQNLQCCIMDWNKPDKKLKPDVLLLSDINYEPASFDVLYNLLVSYIEQDTTILLSTPQRLVAKSFMDRLQPWCRKTYAIDVKRTGDIVFTSVWLLSL